MFASSSHSRNLSRQLFIYTIIMSLLGTALGAVTPTSSTITPAATTKAATPTSSSSSSTGTSTATPTLQLASIPTVTACSDYRLQWSLTGEAPTLRKITLNVINIDVPQSLSSGSSSSSIITANKGINTTLVTQQASFGYTWNVSVPQGRYYIQGQIDDTFGTTAHTQIFSVMQGSDTSCLAAFAALQPSSSSPSSKATASATKAKTSGSASASASRSATVGGADAGSSSSNSGGGISGGAIAGIVVGALAVIGAILAFFLWRRRKNRAQRSRDWTNEKNGMGGMGGGGHGYNPAVGVASLGTDESTTVEGQVDEDKERWTPENTITPTQAPVLPAMAAAGGLGYGEYQQQQHNIGSNGGFEEGGHLTPPRHASRPSEDSDLAYLARGPYHDLSPYPAPSALAAAPAVFEDDPPSRRASDYYHPYPAYPADSASGSGSAPRSRSFSQPGENVTPPNRSRQASYDVGSGSMPNTPATVGRTNSKRRKPVPSLGEELRGELGKVNRSGSGSAKGSTPPLPGIPDGGVSEGLMRRGSTEEKRRSYKIMPDPPMTVDE